MARPARDRRYPYVRVRKDYAHAREIRTDDRGSMWLLVGTDSGFEGLTGLYLESITVRINPVARPGPFSRGSGVSRGRSEQHLQAELNLPRGVGLRRDRAEAARRDAGIRAAEARRVEGVQRLGAELNGHPFRPRGSS